METKIEASCLQDEKFAKEMYSHFLYKDRPFTRITAMLILALLSGFLGIVSDDRLLSASCIICSLALLFFTLLLPIIAKKGTKTLLARNRELNHGNDILLQIFVTENSIITKSPADNSSIEFDISSMKKASYSKNYIYLLTKAKSAIVFDISNFSKGTPEELLEFLRQKGVKVK